MEKYIKMRRPKNLVFFALIVLLAALSTPARGERVSLKFSYSTNNISGNDINTWVDSFNLLWKDWRDVNGGTLQGQFVPLKYSNGLEAELRVPLYKGLAINLAGSWYSSSEEGAVTFDHAGATQSEEQYIQNKVTAVPLKLGLSYAFALPPFPRLSILAGVGRHILFVSYKSTNNYQSLITDFGQQFNYRINKDNEYSSESLGFYANLGVELEILEFLAFVVEGEKVWNSTDGFKGAYRYEALGFPGGDLIQAGKASLYFYDSDHIGTGTFYSVLAGHESRPEDQLDYPLDGGPIQGPEIKNVRQGELDFNTVSFKIGIRFKF
jgi:hypothetical protein